MPALEIELPMPPSLNNYYRHVGPRVLISRAGRKFREVVVGVLRGAGLAAPLDGAVAIEIEVYPPDRRRRDLDNILKALLDSLTAGGLYHDDSQVKELHAWMRAPIEHGMIVVRACTDA